MGAAKQHMLEELEKEQQKLDEEAQKAGWRDNDELESYLHQLSKDD